MRLTVEQLKANTKPAEGGCLEWTRGFHGVGYGSVSSRYEGGSYAHRAMYLAAHGEIPPKMYVLHRCDNRKCINPEHLFLGTHLDNIRDMQKKGRHRGGSMPGESNPFAKFSDTKIEEIRLAASRGERKRDIERQFGISETHYYRIVKKQVRAMEVSYG